MAVDGGHLGHHCFEPLFRGSQNQGVPAGVAGPPQAYAGGVYLGPALQIGHRAAPILDLLPGIYVVAEFTLACAEIPVVMDQDHKSVVGKAGGVRSESVGACARIAVGHGDGGMRPGSIREVEPSAELDAPLGGEFNIQSFCHESLFSLRRLWPGKRENRGSHAARRGES